jgi:hypothetical protein
MDAQQAFAKFVNRALLKEKAERFVTLSESKKGQQKILDSLCHQFESAIRPSEIRRKNYEKFWSNGCYVFHSSLGFGVEFSSVREAYDKLSIEDSWLILLQDASAGIYRPEGKWDDEKLIIG